MHASKHTECCVILKLHWCPKVLGQHMLFIIVLPVHKTGDVTN